MVVLDEQMLITLGLGILTPQQKNAVLERVLEVLQDRVGAKLGASLSERQLDEFSAIVTSLGEAGALQWLERNVDDYGEVVRDELALIAERLRAVAAAHHGA